MVWFIFYISYSSYRQLKRRILISKGCELMECITTASKRKSYGRYYIINIDRFQLVNYYVCTTNDRS
jgi:general stress protein CsbA